MNANSLKIKSLCKRKICPSSNLIFENVSSCIGRNIIYDKKSGIITITKNGIYYIDWRISLEPRCYNTNSFELNLITSNNEKVKSTYCARDSELIGYCIIKVETPLFKISLQNTSSNQIIYLNSTSRTKACLILIDISDIQRNVELQGPQGPTGPVGPVGPEGPVGPKGSAGPVGPPGPIGPPGREGFIGPEGPAGPIGPEGREGREGPAGPIGPEGPAGPIGPEGPIGPIGPEGREGREGPAGPIGPEGPAGPIGPEGPIGPIGPEGREGPIGPQGLQGPTGSDLIKNIVNGSAIGSLRGVDTEPESVITPNLSPLANTYKIGIDAISLGTLTKASGLSSLAEGYKSNTNGDYSHAEGLETSALGVGAHAEGSSSTAMGAYSHAEGLETMSVTTGCHSEGLLTVAGVTAAHAEGFRSVATGSISHAEGFATTSSGICSHTEGYQTIASSSSCHAEGFRCYATGKYAHAEGWYSTASGGASHAEGNGTKAIGEDSHSEGSVTIASATGSHAEGILTEASSYGSHAEGRRTIASSTGSHSEGFMSKATNDYSHAEGWDSTASGTGSHSEGVSTEASGYGSHAEGQRTIASGTGSHSEGSNTIASSDNSHAGGYNTNTDDVDGAFIIGKYGTPNSGVIGATGSTIAGSQYGFFLANGVGSFAPGLAAKILGDGNMYILGKYNAQGADYAEMFESYNGNKIEPGYFITFASGQKIKKANENDNYILGITSSNSTIIGNCNDLCWKGKYLTDDWGNFIYENSELVLNPEWDNNKKYVPRSLREEWVIVGLLGQILVRDNGECKQDEYCKVGPEGIAIPSITGYRVLTRTGKNQILILFR